MCVHIYIYITHIYIYTQTHTCIHIMSNSGDLSAGALVRGPLVGARILPLHRVPACGQDGSRRQTSPDNMCLFVVC